MTTEFDGEYAALLTPFDENEEVDLESLSSLAKYAQKQGLKGVYVGGSTAEAFLQSLNERADCLTAVADASDKLKLIAHVGTIRTKDCCDLAKIAKGAGYDAVSAVTPFYYGFGFDSLLDHYRAIIDAADGLPMIVYNIPVLSGVALTDVQIEQLLNLESVVGLKQTSGDMYQLEKIASKNPEKAIFNGFDEVFLPGQMAGAKGGIGSTYNVMGRKFQSIQKAIQTGNIKDAMEIQQAANRVIDALVTVGVIPGLKYILKEKGVIASDNVRAPFQVLNSTQKKLINNVVTQLGL